MKDKSNVAYFCMEYGLNEELPIYSGGLGVLAGDYLKAADDLDLPLVGIGILWDQGYTHQYIGEDGRPYDTFPTFDFDEYLQDTGVTVTVTVDGEEVNCKVKLLERYDNAPLYLLDTNISDSKHSWITSKLYDGDEYDRIAQEIVLGIGGVRALRELNINVDKYHFNEGHAVFAGVELIREKMEAGMSFSEAKEATREEIVFTTHTPVEAGNEAHDHGLLRRLGVYNSLDYEMMESIGGNPFNMTVAGLKLSSVTNGVSKLHEQTTKEMWEDVEDKAPITGVTNGVHANTWQDERMKDAYEAGEDLWQPHSELKQELVDYIAGNHYYGTQLDTNTLIIGFARRAAEYKRWQLIFENEEKIAPLLEERKLQLVFSGKAHPDDELGKDIVQSLVQIEQRYKGSVVFLENYNLGVAQKMIKGCDVWLNNPRRPLEASGTSGMKAAMNGVLNLSVVDGWVGEGVEHNVSGWLIDELLPDISQLNDDQQDAEALYKIIYDEILPTYYEDRDKWKKMMRASIDMSQEKFSAQRMIKDYYTRIYNPK
ncbi:alpha-glucan family phosphorylase [Acetohalobium arabaticum]|uniref:glycogen phosphorylase n=1 Tax=Acetohalobium arabaticum (strain ATCC 49924 / DSM 5501 / Z-7288) TaxID=574087 RepID=D9QQ16_ACEAZ|nr:alpha-glucan family phosphorylase [Acetohalobium arabaticum]ADL12607.1 alpha-glucan phosphorylase [Acetohalobium arabaticum DSM 5501]